MAGANTNDEAKLRIFPNEVWEMILGEVKDAPNYHRIGNASPHFRSLLLPRAPQILFPEVAKALVPQHVRVRESLPMRQVCREWRQGVDQRLQTANLYSLGEKNKNLIGIGCYEISTSFGKEEDFTTFEQHFDPTHHLVDQVNPFVSRGIKLNIEYNNEDDLGLAPLEPFYTACNRMLQKYGCHLWYLTINLWHMNYPEGLIDFFKRRLPAILLRMPSIQVLVILSPELEQQEWESVEQIPFPNLHKLHSLCLSEMPPSVVRELVLKNQQIRAVETGSSPELIQIYMELLPNLSHLDLSCVVPGDFEVFRSAKVKGRIETLWLDISNPDWVVSWEEVFSTLKSKFSETLTELRLSIPSFIKQERDLREVPELALPNLKRLSLSMWDNVWPLDFLLPMRNTLEYLHVELWLDEEVDTDVVIGLARDRENDINLYDRWRELAMANAWTKFPKLQLLQTAVYRTEIEAQEECYSCTRDQWKKAQSDLQ